MASVRWKNSAGGTWSVGSNWSGGSAPGIQDTVLIAKAPSAGAYVIDIVSPVDVASVTLNQALATLDVIDTSLTTSLALKSGTLALGQYDPAYTKQRESSFSGTVTEGAGTLLIGQYGATLSGVTWEGVLAPVFDLNESTLGTIDVTHGLTLTGANGHGPGILVLGNRGTMAFADSKTLDHATVTLDGTLTTERTATAAATLTLGLHLVVSVGGYGVLATDDTIVNDGQIEVTGLLYVQPLTGQPSLLGTFVNNGTLTIDGGSAMIETSSITSAGTITVDDGGTLTVAPSQGVILSLGSLDIENGLLNIGNPSQSTGPAYLTQTTISLSSAGSAQLSIYGDLSLDGTTDIIQQASLASIVASSALTNSGTISGAVAGGTLAIATSYSFVNDDTISVSNGDTLDLQTNGATYSGTGGIDVTDATFQTDYLQASELFMFDFTNALIEVEDSLTANNMTLTVGDRPGQTMLEVGSPTDTIYAATMSGGTLLDTGGGLRLIGNVILEDVTYRGSLSLATPYLLTTFTDGTTVANLQGTGPGSIALTGAQSTLFIDTYDTLDDVVLTIGNVGLLDGAMDAPRLKLGNSATLGAQSTIVQGATYAAVGAGTGPGNIVDAITGYGTIDAAVFGGQFTVDGLSFTNAGTIAVSNGDIFISASATFVNAGQITLTGATIDLALTNYFQSFSTAPQSFTNDGSIAIAGGQVFQLTYGGTYPDVPILNASGAAISGYGLFSTDIDNAGHIEATQGTLSLAGTVSGAGTVQVDAGAVLSLAQVMPGQIAQFSGTGGELSFAPMSFLGSIGGFAAGDTLDLHATDAVSASFSGDAILLTLVNGRTEMVQTTTALTGSLVVTDIGSTSVIAFAAPGDMPGVAPFWVLPPHQ